MLLNHTICIWFCLRAISYYMRISYSRGRALKQRSSIFGPHTFFKKKWTACPRMNVLKTAKHVPLFRLVFSISSLQFFVVTGLLSRFLFHVTKQVPAALHILFVYLVCKKGQRFLVIMVVCDVRVNGTITLFLAIMEKSTCTHNHMRYVLCRIRHWDRHRTP